MAPTLHSLLEAANLLAYEDALLEQGADDIEQLRELSDSVFDQICDVVGLTKKPLHLLRFKKALNKDTSSLPSSNATGPQAANISLSATCKEPSEHDAYLPACIMPGAATSDFQELVDEHTPIQASLGPAPFTPQVWDPKRAELISNSACIYGRGVRNNRRKTEDLTVYEANINEAAAQLCLRDPTLLVRRDELFALARRAVRLGGFNYSHGTTRSKDAVAALVQVMVPPNVGKAREDPVTARAKRLARMTELDELITKNKSEQAIKIRALEQAQVVKDYPQVYQQQTQIEMLGNACVKYQSELHILQKRQRRSDRYFSEKAKRMALQSESNPELPQPVVSNGEEAEGSSGQEDEDDELVVEEGEEEKENIITTEGSSTSVVYVNPVDPLQQLASNSNPTSNSSSVSYQPTSIFQVIPSTSPTIPQHGNMGSTYHHQSAHTSLPLYKPMLSNPLSMNSIDQLNTPSFTGQPVVDMSHVNSYYTN